MNHTNQDIFLVTIVGITLNNGIYYLLCSAVQFFNSDYCFMKMLRSFWTVIEGFVLILKHIGVYTVMMNLIIVINVFDGLPVAM